MCLGVPELGQGTSETWGCSGGARVADNKGELLGIRVSIRLIRSEISLNRLNRVILKY